MKKRKNHTPGFKTKVVIEAIQERETIQEIGQKYDLHPNQISTWKTRLLSGASSVFENGSGKDDTEKERA
ncbi:MAG: transposase, partial [Bacteroidales bacterium]|nr:transposase [Bacteroidales bacterium]